MRAEEERLKQDEPQDKPQHVLRLSFLASELVSLCRWGSFAAVVYQLQDQFVRCAADANIGSGFELANLCFCLVTARDEVVSSDLQKDLNKRSPKTSSDKNTTLTSDF